MIEKINTRVIAFSQIVIALITISLMMLFGCAYTIAFHNSADAELDALAKSLTNTPLENLFRQHPTLRLVKSTDIGNGNTRHEFTCIIAEDEDTSKRPAYSNELYLYERHTTFYINIFVGGDGIIYEVLDPVRGDSEVVRTQKRYDRWEKKNPSSSQTLRQPK